METDLPERWTRVTLGEIGRFMKGRGGTKNDDEPAGVPVIRYGELYTKHDDIVRQFHSFVSTARAGVYTPLKIGDIVFAASGETAAEIGKSAAFLGPEPAYTSGDTLVLRPGKSADSKFLGYALNGPIAARAKASFGQGASVVHIYARDLQALSIPLPPFAEQRKIAAILSRVDDAISATRKVIAQTERVKRGLLETLMTRGIGHTRFKQTEIGEIPESWEVVRLGDVFEERREPGLPGLPVKSVTIAGSLLVDRDSLERRVESDLAARSHALVRTGDVAYNTMRMWQGACGLATEDCIVSPAYVVVSPVPDRVVPDFARFLFSSCVMIARFEAYSQGVTSDRWRLYFDSFAAIPAAFPPLEEQRALVRVLDSIEAAEHSSGLSVQRLLTLKRGLMRDLLTGRVRVPTD